LPQPNSFDRTLLDRWCAAVGPAVVESFAPAVIRPAGTIAVVTWNTHVGSGDIGALVASLQRGDVAGAPLMEFVLLLQEAVRRGAEVPTAVPRGAAAARRIVGPAGPGQDVVAAARAAGLNVAYVPSMRNGRDAEDRGNAVLSTLPLLSIEAIELPFGRQRRVAVSVMLRASPRTRPFRVVDVHLDTALRFGSGGPARWRRRQADALVDALKGTEVPTIVAGDLNSWWGNDEPAVQDLRRAFPGAVDRVRRDTWSGPLASSARLDHMFASGWNAPLDVRRWPRRFGSDHFPLYVVIPDIDAEEPARAAFAAREGSARGR
jgi:endonuclease/exonuclease/phosphatase family metal-dependent hydrolase